jgi:quercetin dioxygenase-like cupin family protein
MLAGQLLANQHSAARGSSCTSTSVETVMAAVTAGAIVEPGGGTPLRLGPGRRRVILGPDSNSQIGLLESELPPGGGFPVPHWHDDLDEVYYVLAGQIDYLLDHDWHRAGAGTTVYIPAGTVHAFRNGTDQPGRHLLIGLPEVMAYLLDMSAHPSEAWETVSLAHRTHFVHDE